MEENKKKEQPKKLTYEQLNQAASSLHADYQKLSAMYQKLSDEYQKAVEALNNRDFDYTSFFVSMLFKVMEHPEMYKDDFVSWVSEHIENALYSFDKAMTQNPEEKKDEAE